MSHFSKTNLILSRQALRCTSGNDGCCLTCEENVPPVQNLSTNYFAGESNGKWLSFLCTHDNSGHGQGIDNR